MKYNDESFDIDRFDEIAREYNRNLVNVKVKTESFMFEEVIMLAGKILGIASGARLRFVKNSRFAAFDALLCGAIRLLGEFCQGECGRNIEEAKSELSIADLHRLLSELIKKLIRIEINDPHKRGILHNIIDKFMEILLKLIEEE